MDDLIIALKVVTLSSHSHYLGGEERSAQINTPVLDRFQRTRRKRAQWRGEEWRHAEGTLLPQGLLVVQRLGDEAPNVPTTWPHTF